MTDGKTPPPQVPRWLRRALLWVLQGALLIGVVVLLHAWQTRTLINGVAPDFTGTLLDGQSITLGELRGRPVLLHFWATWCPVCRIEQNSINQIAGQHQVLSVALDDLSALAMQQWMHDRKAAFPVVLDPPGRIAKLFGVRGVPTSIIIDAEGRIRFVSVGYTTAAGLRIRLWWTGLTGDH